MAPQSFQSQEQLRTYGPETSVGARVTELTLASLMIDRAFALPAAAPVMPGVLAGEIIRD